MKLLILGYGRGGKDTLAEHLRDTIGVKFISSSLFAAEKVVYPQIKNKKGYTSLEECYEDRANNRDIWHSLIKEYNTPQKDRLAKEMLEEGYDVYVGMRCKEELNACKESNLFDLIIWVDGVLRTDYVEPPTSCTVNLNMADIVITNNGTEEEFKRKIDRLFGSVT